VPIVAFKPKLLNGCYVPIADYLAGAYRATRMAAVDESGQSTSIKSDTACGPNTGYDNLDAEIGWFTSVYRHRIFGSTSNDIV
jgi:hypothetical protein